MATNIIEDFDEESQNQLVGLKMLDFEQVMENRQNSSFQSVIKNKSFEERSNEYSKKNPFGEGSVFYKQKGIKALIGEIENKNVGKWVYVIKTASQGTELIEEYKKYDSVLAESEGKFDKNIDFIIYLETDYNVSFGDVLLIKMSNAMLKAHFESLKELPDPKLLMTWSKLIYEQNRNTPGFKASIEDLMNAFMIEVEYRLIKNFGEMKYTPSEFWSATTDKISEKIRELKIDRESWDPTVKSEKYKAVIFEKAIDSVVLRMEDIRNEISDFRKKLEIMNRIAGFFSDRPGFIDKTVQFLQFIEHTITKTTQLLKGLKNGGRYYFAFICGIINGMIEFICGLVDVVLLIMKILAYDSLSQGAEVELDVLKIREGLEEFIEDYINNPNLIDKKVSEMAASYSYARYEDKNLTGYQVAHNAGEDLVITIDIILSFIAIIKGIAKSSEYLPKFARWIDDVIERGGPGARQLENILTIKYAELSDDISRIAKAKKAIQNSKDLDELYKAAKIADKELREVTKIFAQETKGIPGFRNELKGRERALEKINSDYSGDASKLLDIAGSKVVYKRLDELYDALKRFGQDFEIIKFKDRIQKPLASGYRDVLMNIRMKNGHIVEFRLHLEEMDKVANGVGHKLYEKQRSLEALSITRPLTKTEKYKLFMFKNQQYRVYNEAWEIIINKK
ncbi:hypothetical protein [Flavobacterium lindanitolerans]|uniref:hypothetical protein n=1 Tax=Flavobacterium lindanitolerans TaxID=428988 RepID=UPI0027B8E594|nr:hypothetical protein [Flavobacterium lindanitolerans]